MKDPSEPIILKVKQILRQFRFIPLKCGKKPSELYLHRQMRIQLVSIKPLSPRRIRRHCQKFKNFKLANVFKLDSLSITNVNGNLGPLYEG